LYQAEKSSLCGVTPRSFRLIRGCYHTRGTRSPRIRSRFTSPAWDISAVPVEELARARTFVNNWDGYTPAARFRLAYDLAARIWPFVGGPVGTPHPEQFLEAVLMVMAVRG